MRRIRGLETAVDVGLANRRTTGETGERKWLQLSRVRCMLPALGTRKRSGGVLVDRARVGAALGKMGNRGQKNWPSILT